MDELQSLCHPTKLCHYLHTCEFWDEESIDWCVLFIVYIFKLKPMEEIFVISVAKTGISIGKEKWIVSVWTFYHSYGISVKPEWAQCIK